MSGTAKSQFLVAGGGRGMCGAREREPGRLQGKYNSRLLSLAGGSDGSVSQTTLLKGHTRETHGGGTSSKHGTGTRELARRKAEGIRLAGASLEVSLQFVSFFFSLSSF